MPIPRRNIARPMAYCLQCHKPIDVEHDLFCGYMGRVFCNDEHAVAWMGNRIQELENTVDMCAAMITKPSREDAAR